LKNKGHFKYNDEQKAKMVFWGTAILQRTALIPAMLHLLMLMFPSLLLKGNLDKGESISADLKIPEFSNGSLRRNTMQ